MKKTKNKKPYFNDMISKLLTPKSVEAMRIKRLERIECLTAEYQLGYYVGNEIVRRYLPCLSIDMIKTNNIIHLTPEEELKAKQLSDTWFKGHNTDIDGEDVNWITLRAFHEEMEEKYLPKTLECYLEPLNIKDMSEFKRGIGTSLWDCDICHYKIEEGEIDVRLTDDYFFTIITLKR